MNMGDYTPDALSKLSCENLMRRVKQNDCHTAFAILQQRHAFRDFCVARAWTNCASDAEDCVQEMHVRIWQYRHTYDLDRKFGSWSLSILRNCCKDFCKKQGQVIAQIERETSARANPGEVYEELQICMAKLPENMFNVFVLRVLVEKNIEETSSELGISAGTVGSRLNRAIARLKACLTKRGVGPQ